MAERAERPMLKSPLNIFEVHLGSWKRHGNDVPTAIASFAMTALFIYLLWDQLQGGSAGKKGGEVKSP